MRRKTKIIATLGPVTSSLEMIGKLMDAGMNLARLNMSHAPHDWVRQVVKDIREAARIRNLAVGIIMDTQGPAIRTGDLPAELVLKPGEKFTLTVRGATSEETHSVDVNYENIVNDIHVGDVVLVDNGAIRMKVLAKTANKIECQVLTEGRLSSRRHINLPGVKVSLPALTAKDIADVELGLEVGVDYIALSFTREAKDLQQLKAFTQRAKNKPLIIAKIEDQEAVKNLESIIQEADAIMLARGDLGIEVPYEELPIIQRRVIKECLRIGRPVIVATHMLESMIQSPMPTRAEVTDVANAVFEQADAIMLSGETTVGKYPIQCVEVFDRIARRIEMDYAANLQYCADLTTLRHKLARSAVFMADELHADAVVVFTMHGHLAQYTSWMRPKSSPIYAVCNSREIADRVVLNYAVTPVIMPFDQADFEKTVTQSLNLLVERQLLERGNTVVVITSIAVSQAMADSVQMRKV